jgi:hypothetical protein
MWDYQKQQSLNLFKVRPVNKPGEWRGNDHTEILPPDLGVTKEAKDVLVDCCVGQSFQI